MRRFAPLLLAACSQGFALDGRLFDPEDPSSLELAARLAREHLEATDGLVGVHDVGARRVTVDAHGGAHVRLAQLADGLPVFGAEVRVHLDPDGVPAGTVDALARDLDLPASPSLDAGAAIERVAGGVAASDARATLMAARWGGADRLVWSVELARIGPAGPELPRVLVDAASGEEVLRWDDLQTLGQTHSPLHGPIGFPVASDPDGFTLFAAEDGLRTWTLAGATPNPREVAATDLHDVRSPTPDGFDPVAATAHWGAVETLRFLRERLGRDGIDGAGGPTPFGPHASQAVHYGSAYNNAFWNGSAAYFGDGDGQRFGPLVGLDIVAHELGHGVTDFTADLLYFTESGALNESFSDVLGALVEEAVIGPESMWAIGESVVTPATPGDALRRIDAPTIDGSSRDHLSSKYAGPFDNGGVHRNSGIPNLAFHLVAMGGQHPTPWHVRRGVRGIGTERAGAIWFHALTHELGWLDDFADAREATLRSARLLYGEGSFEEEAVADAWAEVGVGDPFGGPMDPAELPPQPVALATFEGLGGSASAPVTRSFTVPSGTQALLVRTSGGTGDPDLYVNRGAPGTTSSTADCRSWEYGPEESCRIDLPAGGTWYVTLKTFLSEFAGTRVEILTVGP